MKKPIVAIALSLILLSAGYIAAGPFITVHQIKVGIEERDSEKLRRNIDFDLLRKNLKEQLNVYFMEQVKADAKDNPFGVFAVALGSIMVEKLIDSFVTPSGLARVMAGEKLVKAEKLESPDEARKSSRELFKNARYEFHSIDEVSVFLPTDKGEETKLVLTRNGLNWKLNNIVIPMEDKYLQSS